MKLHEIFDPIVNDTVSHRDDIEKMPIGTGYYSHVFNSKSDPHMVNKIDKSSDKENNYWIFVNALLESKIYTHNPHFPRIYSVNSKRQTAQVEKLISFKDIDDTLLKHYLENNFTLDEKNDMTGHDQHALICALLSFKPDINMIKSPSIKKAISFVYELQDKWPDTTIDFGMNNIMYRRIPSGIQLVISDPLA